MTNPFCGGCNRIRLTADGKIKNCLFSNNELDLLTKFRQGEDITNLINENIESKKKSFGGQFKLGIATDEAKNIENRSMISIGG